MRVALLIVAPLAVAIVAQVGSTGYDRDPGGGGWPADPTLQQLVKDTGLYGCTIETITPADVDGRASHSRSWADRPVMLRGPVPGPPSSSAGNRGWASPAALVAAHGNEVREVRWPIGVNQFGLVRRKATVSDFVQRQMERGDGGLLFDAVFDNETVEIPAIFHQRGLDELMVSVGSSGMGLPFHNHAAAWQRVVSGEKLFLFLPPIGRASWLDDLGGDPADVLARLMMSTPRALVTKHLAGIAGLNGTLQYCVVRAGDTVYIPCNWYHATVNIGAVVAVGGQQNEKSWSDQNCDQDLFGAAHTMYLRSKRRNDIRMLKDACRMSMGFQYECALQIATLEAKSGGDDGAGAFAALQAGWDRLERWLDADLLADPVASAVLFRYAEVILRSKLSQTKSGMGQAARMLRRASDLDPGAQNLKLQLLASILGLSQITSKRGGNVAVAAAERLGVRVAAHLISRLGSLPTADLAALCTARKLKATGSDASLRKRLLKWWKSTPPSPRNAVSHPGTTHPTSTSTLPAEYWYEVGTQTDDMVKTIGQLDGVLAMARKRMATLPDHPAGKDEL